MAEGSEPSPHPEKICNVDRAAIERFLVLIRDNYPKADRASFFLEEVSGKTAGTLVFNLRDILSHLATMLAEDTSPDQWEAQIISAEEHFRRAIQEPYAVALGDLRQTFRTVHTEYNKMYPRIGRYQERGLFAGAPSEVSIQAQLRKIAELATEGRSAKRRNRIDAKWDEGVASTIEAYDKLLTLQGTLSGHIHEYESIKDGSSAKFWRPFGVIVGIVLFLLSGALVIFPDSIMAIQRWLGILH